MHTTTSTGAQPRPKGRSPWLAPQEAIGQDRHFQTEENQWDVRGRDLPWLSSLQCFISYWYYCQCYVNVVLQLFYCLIFLIEKAQSHQRSCRHWRPRRLPVWCFFCFLPYHSTSPWGHLLKKKGTPRRPGPALEGSSGTAATDGKDQGSLSFKNKLI